MHRGALWETADEFIEKLLGTDLKVEWITAVLNADVEELCTSELWAA